MDLKVVERRFSRGLTIVTEKGKVFSFSAYGWIDTNFEILSEEDEEIDIEAIEELKHIYIYKLPPNVEKVDDIVK